MADTAFQTPTPEQLKTAAAFMYDVFAATGNYSGIPKRSVDYTPIENDKKTCLSFLRKIVSVVKKRSLVSDGTKDVFNSSLDRCYMAARTAKDLNKADFKFCSQLPSSGANPEPMVKPSEDQILDYIAWFCAGAHLYWDDTVLTDIELAELQETVLGSKLQKYGCFISQVNPAKKKEEPDKSSADTDKEGTEEETAEEPAGDPTSAEPASADVAETAKEPAAEPTAEPAANTSSDASAGSGSSIKYSQSGGHLDDIPNIRSKTKVQIDPVYAVTANPIGSNMPAAFITPILWDSTKKVIMKQTDARAKIVKFASGNGYTDCELFFKTVDDAEAFRKQLVDNGLTNKYQNVRVAQPKADKGGYFEVDTNFGPAYIRAKKLNEELIEAVEAEQPEQPEKRSSASYNINDIQSFSEMLLNCN